MDAAGSSLVSNAATVRFELANGITIAADAYGNPADPPVLFLHGGGQTRHAWGGAAERLGKMGFYAISMDHRGHGESSWDPGGNYYVPAFVEDLLGVIGQLREKPVLVGASIGGIAALLAEAESSESVAKGIVLVDVTPRLEKKGVDRIIEFMKGGAEGFGSLDEVADAVSTYLPHRRRPKDLTGLTKNLRKDEDGRYQWHWDPKVLQVWDPASYTAEQGEEILRERLAASARLSIPTLLVRGRMSDVVTEEHAREFLAVTPHAEYVDLEGAAHMVAGDKNDVFTDVVSDFIQRHFGS
ncbi:MAG: alpha/beta hydrolase [Polyangiales bacterium]